jgi:5'-deoxynucleotidase YfbR-like HD superfamily hydrolase|tara:strand:+ start:69944 stop:70603 length:660 start_codon:yes stop_codon:yes gene_type:complete
MSKFVALWLRAKVINRWPLQGALKPTNVAEHSFECSVIGFMLGAIELTVFKNNNISPEKVCTLCTLHEASEVSGVADISKPVKYHDNKTYQAIKKVEDFYEDKLLNSLDIFPTEMRELINPFIKQDKSEPHAILAKHADHIHALYESEKEVRLGNFEFNDAYNAQVGIIEKLCSQSRACNYFMTHFYPAFHHSIDKLTNDALEQKTINIKSFETNRTKA